MVQWHLLCLQHLLWQCKESLYISHIRGHSALLGPLAPRNATADPFTCLVVVASSYDQACQLHTKYHLNTLSLQHRTGCSWDAAFKITTQCPNCAPYHTCPSLGVNPRGLITNDLWQMSITHIPTLVSLSSCLYQWTPILKWCMPASTEERKVKM